MDLSEPLAVVTPSLDGSVLRILALADQAFTPGDVQRIIGQASVSGVRKVLARLTQQGIVHQDRVGSAFVYRLNRAHLASHSIIELASLRQTLLTRLSEELRRWDPAPGFAAIFGSAARGDMGLDSDIDVFLVRPDSVAPDSAPWETQRSRLVSQAADWTGNDVRVFELSLKQAQRRGPERSPILAEIERDGITIIGDKSLLAPKVRRG